MPPPATGPAISAKGYLVEEIGDDLATAEDKHLESTVLAAFGRDEARVLVATLGPGDVAPMLGCKCDCSTESDYCWSSVCRWAACRCRHFEDGCGFLWDYPCDGYCSDCESCQP